MCMSDEWQNAQQKFGEANVFRLKKKTIEMSANAHAVELRLAEYFAFMRIWLLFLFFFVQS